MPLKWYHYSIQAQGQCTKTFEIDYNADAVTSGRGRVTAPAPIVGTGVSAAVAKICEIINKEYIAMYQPEENASSDGSSSLSSSFSIVGQAVLSSLFVVVPSTAFGPNANLSQASSSSKLALISMLERRSEAVNNKSVSALQYIQQELVSYLSPMSLMEEEKLCPLLFWAKHSDYPYFSKFAKYHLNTSASFVLVECMFSITGLLIIQSALD